MWVGKNITLISPPSTHHFKPQYLIILVFHFITDSSLSQYHTTLPKFLQFTNMHLHSAVHTLRVQLLHFTSAYSTLHPSVTPQHHSSNSPQVYISTPHFTPLRVQFLYSTSTHTHFYYATHYSILLNMDHIHQVSSSVHNH